MASPGSDIEATVAAIASAETWNKRVALIRKIPEWFGKAQHQAVYGSIAKVVYVPYLAPDFAFIHWLPQYELPQTQYAYERADALTHGFADVDPDSLSRIIAVEPVTLRVFRLLLGFTTQEFAAATAIPAEKIGVAALADSMLKAMEAGKATRKNAAKAAPLAAAVVDQAMRGVLFVARGGEVRSKLDKPDTVGGWETVRNYAVKGVPLSVFLHQRHYGGAFRQLLDATGKKRGDLLEEAVDELFRAEGILYVRTGSSTREKISKDFGLTVRPAPDYVVHDASGTLRAILECKQVNDGGTARDKAARFFALREEAMRLGGLPLFAVLAGLGWRRTADALGPVIRDTDGRVFSVQTLTEMMTVEPLASLRLPSRS